MGVWEEFGGREYKHAGSGKTKSAAIKEAKEAIAEAKQYKGKIKIRKGGETLTGKGFSVWVSYEKPRQKQTFLRSPLIRVLR